MKEYKGVNIIIYGGYNDTITKGNIQRARNARNAKSWMQIYSSTIQQRGARTYDDGVSNINKRKTYISDRSVKNGRANSNDVKFKF